MHKYLEKKGEVNFDKIFNQRLGKLQIYLFTWFHERNEKLIRIIITMKIFTFQDI